jgi:hypothetical protein
VILERRDSSPVGLSQVEAERRLEKYGHNEGITNIKIVTDYFFVSRRGVI